MDLARHLVITALLLTIVLIGAQPDHAQLELPRIGRHCLLVEPATATARLYCESSPAALTRALEAELEPLTGCGSAEEPLPSGAAWPRLNTIVLSARCVGAVEPASQERRYSLGLKLDLNRATERELQLLPGIGPRRAESIVRYRRRRGPLTDVDQLRAIRGIGPKTAARLRPLVQLTGATESSSAN